MRSQPNCFEFLCLSVVVVVVVVIVVVAVVVVVFDVVFVR